MKTTKQFITEAQIKHTNKYEYPDPYINSATKIRIICKKHGEFWQTPNKHLSGCGCNKCGGSKKLSTKEFIQKATLIHGKQYDYSKTVYINSNTKLRIICKKHGEFWQIPYNHLLNNNCPKCSGVYKPTTKEFIQKARLRHNNKYEYPDKYVNATTKIRIICKEHGEFLQTPNSHLNKQGCPLCSRQHLKNNILFNSKHFIHRAKLIHGNKYEYKEKYTGIKNKLKIICKKHGEFLQTPDSHINGKANCPKCSKNTYSQSSIFWLETIMKKKGIFIQHAENKGEYNIPTTNYKADGYCEANNTVYEFYGDCWHGNLEIYNEDEQCHPFSDECAGNLYIKTMQREQKIKKLGYNLVTIWENEFKHISL